MLIHLQVGGAWKHTSGHYENSLGTLRRDNVFRMNCCGFEWTAKGCL